MFLNKPELQEQARDGVIWIDEAGMLGAKDANSVFKLANQLNARIILSGDRKQLKAVSRGDLLALLEDYGGVQVAELTEIHRQKGDYKKAVSLLSMGFMADGFAALDRMGAIKGAGDYSRLVNEYKLAIKEKKSILVVSATHAEGQLVTAKLREGLGITCGSTVNQLVPLHLSPAEIENPLNLEPGDIVKRFGKNKQAFRSSTIEIAPGDLIRITAGGKTKDGHRLNTGMIYTVDKVNSRGEVVLANGWTLAKDFGHIEYGYVQTTHAAQGKTVDKVIIANAQSPTNMANFYVAASRGREGISVYVDDREDFLRQIHREDKRLLAHDVAKPKAKISPVRDRRNYLRRLAIMAKDKIQQLFKPKQMEHVI
jgi:ATP-dependent exoDNAse (exonuclease V) alpha subunit